ncbi:hypothetical protein EZV62_015332 [Acer yangbiense]|uniref:mannan endo-1,4-beta-mannosidase n=6 Tax=rosids TaxID=71275 RepID=A0A5C7HKD8_9ROSI|nr:hypothetical protein EZV62_015332 [Acer yangbiense]
MSGEEEENAAELKIGDEFLKAKCLMNCEVALILEHKYEQLQQTSEDPLNQISQVFEKSLQYVKRFSRYKNPDAVRQVREVLSRYQLAEFELCVLGNLCPETAEEAMAMVPSITTKGRFQDDYAIDKMLNDLSMIKKFEQYCIKVSVVAFSTEAISGKNEEIKRFSMNNLMVPLNFNDVKQEAGSGRYLQLLSRVLDRRKGSKKTVLVNFMDICETMHRQPDHVMAFLILTGRNGDKRMNMFYVIAAQVQIQSLQRRIVSLFKDVSRLIFSVVILMMVVENSNCTEFGVNGDDQFESMVEEAENHLYSSSTHHGVYDLQDMEDDDWEMVAKSGNQFVVNGKPFYVNGFNTYWLMVFAADQSTRGKVSELFQQASSVGLTVCRTWAFNDGQWRALQKSPSVYDEEVFKALDFVVSEAKKYKIRLILSLVNNWDAYGGKPQYVKWGKDAGLNLTSDDDFFSHPTLRSYYKAHVKTVLNRVNTLTNITYKEDPTIFAWELMNEPRCTSDPSGDKLQSWIQEMAVYVKSMDPKHLVEIGTEGFYGPSTPDKAQFNPNTYATQVGTDFIRNHQVIGVDFASVHIYADSWISQTISDAHVQFTKSWMEAHIADGEKYLGMPVLFAEFGVSSKDGGYNSSFRDSFINTVYKTLLNSTKKGGSGAGSLLWQLFPDGTDYMDDGYAIVISKSPSTSNIISLHSTRLAIFNSMCSWKCSWGCKKKNPLEAFLYLDDL